MAITNFVGDSYCAIDNIHYQKTQQYITFDLLIYRDSSRNAHLATKPIIVNGQRKIPVIKDFNAMSLPHDLETVEDGDGYIISEDVTEHQYLNLKKCRAAWNSSKNDWDWWRLQENEEVYCANTRLHGIWDGSTFKPQAGVSGHKVWERFFQSSVIEKTGLLTQCYLYLNSLDEFKGCNKA